MPAGVVIAAKRVVRITAKQLRRACVLPIYRFGPEQLRAQLRALGIAEGDVLLVHSSYKAFEAFTGNAIDVLRILRELVGPNGTILMPTIPFTGSALEYITHGGLFDVRRTPSAMGLLSELFRRSPDVKRSVHPTHAVAAWGRRAEAIIADHYASGTPCGRATPYGRLLEENGKILLLGTGIRAMTFFHAMEEMLEPRMPYSPFTRDYYDLECKDARGSRVRTHTRLFDPRLSARRNLDRLVPHLKRGGVWRETKIGNMRAILLKAVEVWETTSSLAQNNFYCYDPE